MLIDKDKSPKWKYAAVKDVPDAEVLALFQPFVDSNRELIL